MRVLFISGSFPPMKCGIGEYTALLAGELAATGSATVGVLTGREAAAAPSPAGIELLPLMDDWRLGSLWRLLRAVRQWRPDIVHIQYPTRGYGRGKMPLVLPLVLAAQGIAVVQTWHEPLSFLRGVRYLPCALLRDAFVTVEADYRPCIPAFVWRLLQRKRWFRHIPVGAMIPAVQLSVAERAAVKRSFAAEDATLIAYFGFAIPSKGLEALFTVADPERDRLVLICELDPTDDYQRQIAALPQQERWQGKAFVTGYLPGEEVGRILAAADGALFPFTDGMTGRNTSVYAAQNQGTFVLTTSKVKHGYSAVDNIYYASPGDLDGMRAALRRHAGIRVTAATTDWRVIAGAHLELYGEIIAERSQGD